MTGTKLKRNDELLQKIKNQSWQHKLAVDGQGRQWRSISQIINTLVEPFDEVKVATKCAENATPGSKYWGMSVDEILASWRTKASMAANRGMDLDVYIQSVLHHKPKPIIDEPVLQKKCEAFDKFKQDCLDKVPDLEFIGSEIWLNSEKYAIRGRLDALFFLNGGLVIFDWKNNDKFSMDNFKHMLGPLDYLPQSDIAKFTVQLYGYKYFLQEEFQIPVKSVRVIQFTEDGYTIHKPVFEYDKEFMEEIFDYANSKLS